MKKVVIRVQIYSEEDSIYYLSKYIVTIVRIGIIDQGKK